MSREIIESKIDVIERNLQFLRQYWRVDTDQFLKSYKDIQAVKYSLLEAIEACIDIAAHIVSARGLPRSETYADLFVALGENGILSSYLAARLALMARFRNLLVHGYSQIDNVRVLQLVRERLADIEDFVSQVLRATG